MAYLVAKTLVTIALIISATVAYVKDKDSDFSLGLIICAGFVWVFA